MTVLVALPYFDAEPYLDRAVRSILAQTERDFVLLVVGDGQKPPIAFTHDRLVVHTFPTHHGAPFVQQAMLLGSPFAKYAPFGSDDWADPDHLELMLSYGAPNVCAGAVWWHNDPAAPPVRVRRANYEVGVLDTALLRRIGGYGAQEPFGQDNLLLYLATRTVGLVASDRPTYHRLRRPGSLTTRPETGLRSPLREAVRRRNWKVARRCYALGFRNHEAIRAYRESLIPGDLRSELVDRAGEIGRLLGTRAEVAA